MFGSTLSGVSTAFRISNIAPCKASSSASTSSSSLRATRPRNSLRIRPVASVPTSAVISRVSRVSRISASILRPGSNSVRSAVSHAGPWFNLARRRLKNPRTPGLSASFVIGGMIPGVTTLKTESNASGGRNSVRIIGGGWRGRRVSFPDIPGLRPTPDRVRETLFNWLQQAIAGARCLDLFAGSGALGLEALSRGAKELVFVEQAVAASRALQEQLIRLGAKAKGRVVEMGASRYLSSPPQAFDIVFLDPPFGRSALAEYVPMLDTGLWLKPGALVYLENEKTEGVPLLPPHWQLLKSKSAGEVGYHLARVDARAQVNA